MDTQAEAKILAAVDDLFEAQVRLTQDLVRFPSLRGQEHTIQDFVYELLRSRGAVMDRWRITEDDIKHHPGFSPIDVSYENAWNVVGSFRPQNESGRSLILNAHVDVVPTGPADMWTAPPFEPVIRDGWLFGRGSADMKAGLAANIFALDAIRVAGFAPQATVHVQSVVEEESTGNGTLAASARGYRADAVVCPEPEEEKLVRANAGVVWFSVRLTGRPAHTREMAEGFNAIDAAYGVIAALRKLETRWNAEQSRHRYFEDLEHPINLNVGRIEGGDWNSMVPAWCTVHCRLAMYPGTSADEVRQAVEACVKAHAAATAALANSPPVVRWTGFFCEGYVLEEGTV